MNRNKQEEFCKDCGTKRRIIGDGSCEISSYMTACIKERWENSEPRPHQEPDISEYQSRLQTEIPLSLESCEPEILKQIPSFISDKEVSESKLQFVPPWIIEKAKARELANYKDSLQVFSRPGPPRSAKIVSSHHFFSENHDGERGNWG